MPRVYTPDEQVEAEIERLTKSDAVKLARKELRLKYKRKQYMYQLRNLEKRGLELMEQGVTLETLDIADSEIELELGQTDRE